MLPASMLPGETLMPQPASVVAPPESQKGTSASLPSAGAGADTPSLANFGIVLTGRLGLRNELLSTFTTNSVWDERYFVLTRKGLHYYVRQRNSGDANRRDLFGEHEGSVALGNIEHIDLGGPSDEARTNFEFVIVSKGGGRKYRLRAGSAELYTLGVDARAAINPTNGGAPGGTKPGAGSANGSPTARPPGASRHLRHAARPLQPARRARATHCRTRPAPARFVPPFCSRRKPHAGGLMLALAQVRRAPTPTAPTAAFVAACDRRPRSRVSRPC